MTSNQFLPKALVIIGLILMWPVWHALYIGITTNSVFVSIVSASVGIMMLIIGTIEWWFES